MKPHFTMNPSKSLLKKLSARHHSLVEVASFAWVFHFWFVFFNGISQGMQQHAQFILKKIFDGSLDHISIATSFSAGGLIFGLFTGTYLEGRNKRKFMIFGAMGYAGLSFMLINNDPIYFLIGFGIQCFTIGAVMPTLSSFYQNAYLNTRIRNAYFGYAERYGRSVTMVTTFVAGYVIHENVSNYKIMIVIWIVSGMTAYLILAASSFSNQVNAKYLKERSKVTFYNLFAKPFVRTFKLFSEDRDFWAFQWRFFIYGMAFLSIQPVMINYIVEAYNFDFENIGFVYGIITGMIFIIFLPLFARFNSKLNPYVTGSIACFILSAFTFTFFFSPEGIKVFVYIALGIWSLGMVFIHLLWNLTSIYFADASGNDASAYSGAHLLMVGVRGLTLPILGGQMVTSFGIPSRTMFLISAILFLLASALFVQYQLTHRKEKPEQIS